MQYLPGTWERSPASWRCRPRRIWCRFDWRWIWPGEVCYIHTAWLRLAPCHPPRLVFPSDHTRSSHGFLSRNCIQSTDLVKISRDFVKTSTFESIKQNKTKNKKPKKKKKKEKEQLNNIWHLNTLPPEHPKRGSILSYQPSFYAVYLANDWI